MWYQITGNYPTLRVRENLQVSSYVLMYLRAVRNYKSVVKVEWCGDGFIGLCSKTYYCFGLNDKFSTKGLSKRQNVINKESFLTPVIYDVVTVNNCYL